jgi:hypothetical protein
MLSACPGCLLEQRTLQRFLAVALQDDSLEILDKLPYGGWRIVSCRCDATAVHMIT